MNKEFLSGLGLSDEICESVISEYEKEAYELNEKCRSMSEELADKSTRLESLISSVIAKETRGARFSSKTAENAAVNLMKDAASRGEDIFSVIPALMESDPDAFSRNSASLPVFSAQSGYDGEAKMSDKFSFMKRH